MTNNMSGDSDGDLKWVNVWFFDSISTSDRKSDKSVKKGLLSL